MKLSKFLIVTILCGSSLAYAAGGGSGLFRRDFNLGFSLGNSFFDETAGGNFYQHTAFALGIEAGLRLGIRVDIISLGLAGSYGIDWFDGGRQRKGVEFERYKNEFYRGLGGGFVAINMGAAAESNEILFEYYGYARQTVKYTDSRSENPFPRTDDWREGKGWGLGYGGKRGDSFAWFMYRSISYTNQKVGSTETEYPNDSHSPIHHQMLVMMVGHSM